SRLAYRCRHRRHGSARRDRRRGRDTFGRLTIVALERAPAHDRGTDPLFHDVLLLFLFDRALDPVGIGDVDRAHVIAHRNAARGELRDDLAIVETEPSGHLVDAGLVHEPSAISSAAQRAACCTSPARSASVSATTATVSRPKSRPRLALSA